VNPPARSIRAEATEAVVGGIREKGAEAVGIILIGCAYIAIALFALLVLVLGGWSLGIELTMPSKLGLSALSVAISWLVGRLSQWPKRAS
jgi:hypothetical protein